MVVMSQSWPLTNTLKVTLPNYICLLQGQSSSISGKTSFYKAAQEVG